MHSLLIKVVNIESFHIYEVTSLNLNWLNPLTQPHILKSRHIVEYVCIPETCHGCSDGQTRHGYHGQNSASEHFCTWDGKVGVWQSDESTLPLPLYYPHNCDGKK